MEISHMNRMQFFFLFTVILNCHRKIHLSNAEFSGSLSTFSKRSAPRVFEKRIVGGRRVLDVAEASYQVGFFIPKTGILCGGALVTPNIVISAAHCFTALRKLHEVAVVLGKTDVKTMEPFTQTFTQIDYVIRHPNYDSRYRLYDVAIVKLKQSVCLNEGVQPIPLPANHNSTTQGDRPVPTALIVSGWGYTLKRKPYYPRNQIYNSRFLKFARIDIIDKDNCSLLLESELPFPPDFVMHPTFFCAGDLSGDQDACQGDSGGPVVCEFSKVGGITQRNLCGIVSSGYGCSQSNTPALYVDVAKMVDWIVETINKECYSPYGENVTGIEGLFGSTLKFTPLTSLLFILLFALHYF